MSDWARERMTRAGGYGVPPAGNANFAWLQHIVSQAGLATARRAWSWRTARCRRRQSGEGEIRAALIEADLVACMIALPPQLFRNTQIPACLWFFANDKGPQAAKRLTDRRGDILFIDARIHGHDARPHRAHPHR